MALGFALLHPAALSAQFHRLLLALGVADKLAGLLLNVPRCAGGFVEGPAFLLAPVSSAAVAATVAAAVLGLALTVLRLTLITDLSERREALLDGLLRGDLLEGDLARLLEVLLAHLLLGGLELRDVRVVALLDVLVVALEHGLLLDALHGALLVDAAHPGLGLRLAVGEVDAAGHGLDAAADVVAPAPAAAVLGEALLSAAARLLLELLRAAVAPELPSSVSSPPSPSRTATGVGVREDEQEEQERKTELQ